MVLPENEYFSLEEIADKWKKDVSYVLDQFDAGRLIPSVTLPEIQGEWWILYSVPVWQSHDMGWDNNGERDIVDNEYGNSVGRGTWYIPAFKYGPVFTDSNNNCYIELENCFLSKDRILPSDDNPRRWFAPTPGAETDLRAVPLSRLKLVGKKKSVFLRSTRCTKDRWGTLRPKQQPPCNANNSQTPFP